MTKPTEEQKKETLNGLAQLTASFASEEGDAVIAASVSTDKDRVSLQGNAGIHIVIGGTGEAQLVLLFSMVKTMLPNTVEPMAHSALDLIATLLQTTMELLGTEFKTISSVSINAKPNEPVN